LYRFFAAAIAVFMVSCGSKETPAQAPVKVTSFTVEPKTIPVVFDYVGFAESPHQVEIRARVEGYLDEIGYIEGQKVEEGDLLFQIDPRQFEASVAQAKGEVDRQEAINANAKLTVERLQPLYEKKAASKKDLDNAIASELSSKASLESAQAQLLEAEINLGYTTILSPVNGYAGKANYRTGALVMPGKESLLTTVSVLDPIWVYFSVSGNDILRVQEQLQKKTVVLPKGKKEPEWIVQAFLSDETPYPYDGKVNFSSPTYNQGTGTLEARAVFPNPKAILRPGQFVKLKVYGAKRPNAIVVPRRAIIQKSDGMFVYLINRENKAVAQDISAEGWYEDYQIVTNGLKKGDRIVVDGINKIQPETKVEVSGEWTPATEKTKKSVSNGKNGE